MGLLSLDTTKYSKAASKLLKKQKNRDCEIR